MVAFLRWAGSIVTGAVNGILKFILAVILIVIVVVLIAMARSDGLPRAMVLTLDLRKEIVDSDPAKFSLGNKPLSMMDIVLGLDTAERDSRVKGIYVRVGSGNLPIARAEEIKSALKKFRASGKFVIVHAQDFEGSGLGDYLAATAGDQIWMQPKSAFYPAGAGGGEIFLKGVFDKIKAQPQIAKRKEYKSAADMYMEAGMTKEDREQLVALLTSWYDVAVADSAKDRKIAVDAMKAAFEASPQFTEDAKERKLIDKIGYDDDALGAALAKAGDGADQVTLAQFLSTKPDNSFGSGPQIALIEAAGEIVNGSAKQGPFGGDAVIAGDDMAKAIREATKDNDIKAIILRVDSPGGSVSASDQILDAVKKAQASGKPVVVSMGYLAASGGYYISLSANKIVAEPGTITGSIGVLTGKVAFGNTLGLIGAKGENVGVGKNALINSSLDPYTPEQWESVNHQADVIYDDFTRKVAAGRKLPLEKVQDVARGRIWSGTDAKERGLVDKLGGFWDAADIAKQLSGIPKGDRVTFKVYPRQKSFFQSIEDFFGLGEEAEAVSNFNALMHAPIAKEAVRAVRAAPRGAIELRATNIPE
ncbi:signal peptide peptidase SppA [Rhizomicrobium electricum]|uniref:Signal peptide peptidase SppA n=1 Tax=Rhizomicrobium electricum TaxID=480070 RepID=A0ABN1E8A9_9PROT|nr:signal peptide peptidase SppA [Rhizomicrobium electricum]NIJ47787.1 protease-4 [Rhizomicrobium electricum]